VSSPNYRPHSIESSAEIDIHSVAKHVVYEQYISHYLQTSYANPNIPQANIAFINAASSKQSLSPSQDERRYDDSAVRMIRSAESASDLINFKRQQNNIRKRFTLNAQYYFLQTNRDDNQLLKKVLLDQDLIENRQRQIIQVEGAFNEKVDKIVAEVLAHNKAGRAIFILDQCDWSYVPFEKIRYIFSKLPKAEVIMTFATDWLLHHISKQDHFLQAYARSGLQQVLPVQQLIEIKQESKYWRGIIQYYLHKNILNLCGAAYFTPFFIKTSSANQSFWLLHLSMHEKARDVMTSLHWEKHNQFAHALGRGINMFGYDPLDQTQNADVQRIVSQPEYKFDDYDKELSIQTILGELPLILDKYKKGIRFEELYRIVANHTPATMSMIKDVLGRLIAHKEITVTTAKNRERRKASSIQKDDVIRMSFQLTLFLPTPSMSKLALI